MKRARKTCRWRLCESFDHAAFRSSCSSSLSKIFWLFADPINFLLILGVVGLLLSFGGPTACFGRTLMGVAIVLIAIAGFSPLGSLLLRPLEDRFPRPPADLPAPTGIIVLGGAMDSGLTIARGVPTLLAGGARITEGAALAKRFPQFASRLYERHRQHFRQRHSGSANRPRSLAVARHSGRANDLRG